MNGSSLADTFTNALDRWNTDHRAWIIRQLSMDRIIARDHPELHALLKRIIASNRPTHDKQLNVFYYLTGFINNKLKKEDMTMNQPMAFLKIDRPTRIGQVCITLPVPVGSSNEETCVNMAEAELMMTQFCDSLGSPPVGSSVAETPPETQEKPKRTPTQRKKSSTPPKTPVESTAAPETDKTASPPAKPPQTASKPPQTGSKPPASRPPLPPRPRRKTQTPVEGAKPGADRPLPRRRGKPATPPAPKQDPVSRSIVETWFDAFCQTVEEEMYPNGDLNSLEDKEFSDKMHEELKRLGNVSFADLCKLTPDRFRTTTETIDAAIDLEIATKKEDKNE